MAKARCLMSTQRAAGLAHFLPPPPCHKRFFINLVCPSEGDWESGKTKRGTGLAMVMMTKRETAKSGQSYSVPGGLPGGSVVKNPPANAGDTGWISGSGRSPGEGHGNPFQDSLLGNPMDRGAWRATVHGVTKELNMPE